MPANLRAGTIPNSIYLPFTVLELTFLINDYNELKI